MKILILNCGGTFNKIYNKIDGSLIMDKSSLGLQNILNEIKHNFKFTIQTPFLKDSLEMDKNDRRKILKFIKNSKLKRIIIIHGTDTIDKTAKLLSKHKLNKQIILVGAMFPLSIRPFDGSLNFGTALGFLQTRFRKGVFISMSGLVLPHRKIIKNRKNGIFQKWR